MSDQPGPVDPSASPDDQYVEQMEVEEPRRAASLTLRSEDVRDARQLSMEAANKSLAEALRLTYRALQVVMVALVVIFALSGFEQVNQAESGIRVDFGKIKSEQLDPGFQFAWPYPFGEIIKVQTSSRTIELDRSFWPNLPERDRLRPLDQITSTGTPLKPGRDGSLLTADHNISHAQFTIVYSVTNPIALVRGLTVKSGTQSGADGDFEKALVRAAVRRAVVRVAAESEIDDILKRGSSDGSGGRRENSMESRIRKIAQNTLNVAAGSEGVGIEISQVLLRSATPPLLVRKDFNQVQIAQSSSGKLRDEALGAASTILNTVAGSAHSALIDLIDSYEQAIELKNDDEGAQLLKTILGVLDGAYNIGPGQSSVTVAGVEYQNLRLSGTAAEIISTAQRYRQTVARQARRKSETFSAKRAQYIASPAVFAMAEWSDAYRAFLTRPAVELFWVPPGTSSLEFAISSDPEIERQRETKKYKEDVANNARLRLLNSQ